MHKLRIFRRRRSDSGAVAVEAALITPLIMLLLFGIIEFGFAFKDYLAVSSASRAGVRLASAEPRIATFAQDAADQVEREGAALDLNRVDELWVYDANPASGYPEGTSSFANCTKCVKFVWDQTGGSDGLGEFEPIYTGWTANQQNACATDAARDSVGVFIKYDHDAVTGLVFSSLTLDDHTVMSLEPIPLTKTCKAATP